MPQETFPLSSLDGYTMTDQCARGGHCHDRLEIGWCHEGGGTLAVNGRHFQFQPRSVCIIAPQQRHYLQSTSGNISIWTFLYIDFANLLADMVPDRHVLQVNDLCGPHFQHVLNEDSDPAICEVVLKMVAELRMRQDQWQDKMRRLCGTLAVHFRHLSGRQVPDPEHDQLLEHLSPGLDLIMRQYDKPLSTEDVARACNMTPVSVNRLFEAVFKCTAFELLTRTRTQRAADMLRHSNCDLSEIAVKTGLGDEGHLQQEFRQRFTAAPLAYRRSSQGHSR